jgi:hypothetical protein
MADWKDEARNRVARRVFLAAEKLCDEPMDTNELVGLLRAAGLEIERLVPPGWKCFHCGETFTEEPQALAHFGHAEGHQPGCVEKLTAPEKNLVLALRKVCDEFHRLQIQVSEEITNDTYFYSRLRASLASMPKFKTCISLHDVFMLFDSMEGRALAAEERLQRLDQAPER